MHRFIFMVVLIAYGVECMPNQTGLSRQDVEDMLDRFILGCASIEGASPDEIDFIRSYKPPQNKQQKCSVACVGEAFGLVKDGNILVDNVIHLASRILSEEPEKVEILRKIAEACALGNDPDRCEATTNIYLCCIAEAKKIGFNMKDFI